MKVYLIRRIKEKGKQVYRVMEVISIRDLHSQVVHRGNIAAKQEADKTIKVALDFVAKLSTMGLSLEWWRQDVVCPES